MRETFDLSAYFVVGPENTLGRPVAQIVESALAGGFTFIQLRSKVATAREMIAMALEISEVIARLDKSDQVAFVIDDRLDVVLAAREAGAKVDGIHVGQGDIPVEVCRRYLGEGAIVGLSARTKELFQFLTTVDTKVVDYLGAGPLRETATKPDCGLLDGRVVTRSFEELKRLAKESPLPVVVGGGVKLGDLAELAQTGVAGFFVVSAISEEKNPQKAVAELVEEWRKKVS